MSLRGLFGAPKIKPPVIKPPPTPALDSAQYMNGLSGAYTSMISTSKAGLKRKADTAKRSLLGGS